MTPRAFFRVPVGLLAGATILSFSLDSSPTAEPSSTANAKQPAPKLASIKGARRLSEALQELGSQTSESAADQMGAADPTLDLDLKQLTFWEALDAIADKANARVDLHSRDGVALAPRPAHWHPPRISHSGLFRITLNGMASRLDLETDARACTASVEVAWEPHLLPLLLETRPRSLVVLDDAGRTSPVGAATSSLAPVDGRNSLPFDVALPPVDRTVKTLSLLQGELYAVAPTKMLTFTFGPLDQLADAPAGDPRLQATQEGVECRVSKVVAEDDHWSVQITLDYPEGNVKLDSYQSWVVNNEIHLEGKDGDRFPSDTYLLEESTPRHAVLTYHFTDKERMKRGLGDWKVVYTTPALVVKVQVPFSFKDVPLP